MWEVLGSFFASFDGPAIATALLSAAAVAVSVVALVRSSSPKPHWQADEPLVIEVRDRSTYDNETGRPFWGKKKKWVVDVRQHGAGVAESITTQVRPPDGSWTVEHAIADPMTVGRMGLVRVLLCDGEKLPGVYRVRVRYRYLPKTHKVRTWTGTVRIS
ncbi:hypothetical protein M3667_14235 [Microbacterium sp. P26]|nr:hypothetical protein [Microbacterium sp. P26]